MKKVLFISGEPSGDHSGSYLLKELKNQFPEMDAYGVGGPDMAAVGLRLIHNITELSVIGLIEVFKHYPRLRSVFYDLLKHVDEDKPDAVVLIDYPGFNLRLAKKIKKKHPNLPIIYFVSPQIWAWGHRRIHTIRRVVDLMLVMFPFEVDVYEKGGKWLVENDTIRIEEHKFNYPSKLQTKYVGHWITDKIESFEADPNFKLKYDIPKQKRYIALLPGSRDNEIKTIFPVMLKSAELLRKKADDLFFLISCARPGLKEMVEKALANAGITNPSDYYRIIPGAMYDIINQADFSLVASGTAAFEAALLTKPLLVLYRLNLITILVASFVVKLPFINLANIIAGRRIIPEFIQFQMTAKKIVPAALKLLNDKQVYAETVKNLKAVKDVLGHGDNGVRAAQEICKFMQWKTND